MLGEPGCHSQILKALFHLCWLSSLNPPRLFSFYTGYWLMG